MRVGDEKGGRQKRGGCCEEGGGGEWARGRGEQAVGMGELGSENPRQRTERALTLVGACGQVRMRAVEVTEEQ